MLNCEHFWTGSKFWGPSSWVKTDDPCVKELMSQPRIPLLDRDWTLDDLKNPEILQLSNEFCYRLWLQCKTGHNWCLHAQKTKGETPQPENITHISELFIQYFSTFFKFHGPIRG